MSMKHERWGFNLGLDIGRDAPRLQRLRAKITWTKVKLAESVLALNTNGVTQDKNGTLEGNAWVCLTPSGGTPACPASAEGCVYACVGAQR